MSKVFKALEKIKNLPMKEQYKSDCNGGFTYRSVNDLCGKEIKVIESTLKDYEEYEEIRKSYDLTIPQLRAACLVFVQMNKDISTIHRLKALKIIKRKGIDIEVLRWSNTVAEYNANAKSSIGYTQEEYETVVGVML